MKLRSLMIVLAFSSQLAMATPTCQETCLKAAAAAAKQCTLAPGQVGACVASVASALRTCLEGGATEQVGSHGEGSTSPWLPAHGWNNPPWRFD